MDEPKKLLNKVNLSYKEKNFVSQWLKSKYNILFIPDEHTFGATGANSPAFTNYAIWDKNHRIIGSFKIENNSK